MRYLRNVLRVIPLSLVLSSCSNDVSLTFTETALELVMAAPDSTAVAAGFYLHIPTSITCIDSQLLVIDNRQQCGFWFDLEGNPRGIFGRPGTGPGEMTNPHIAASAAPNGDFWILSDDRLQRFKASGVYDKGFYPDFVIQHISVSPDGKLLATSYANSDRGGVSQLTESGETIWTNSGRLEFEAADSFYRLTNRSKVCSAWDEAWQFFTEFNVIRVFDRHGVFLREFALAEPHLEAMDKRNREQVDLLAQGIRFVEGRGVGPATLCLSVRYYFDSIWVIPQLLNSMLSDAEKNMKFIYRLDRKGTIVERLSYRDDRLVSPRDIVVLSDHPALSVLVIHSGPEEAEIAWLKSK